MAGSLRALKTMVAIFFLLSGNASQGLEHCRQDALVPGDSLNNKPKWLSLENDYTVSLRVYVNNYSSYRLVDPKLHLAGGIYITEPPSVGPTMREGFAMHDIFLTYQGIWGLASWKIHGTGKRWVVMFSVPHGTYPLVVGMGVTDGTVPTNHWWDKMRYNKPVSGLDDYRVLAGRDDSGMPRLRYMCSGNFHMDCVMTPYKAGTRRRQHLTVNFKPESCYRAV